MELEIINEALGDRSDVQDIKVIDGTQLSSDGTAGAYHYSHSYKLEQFLNRHLYSTEYGFPFYTTCRYKGENLFI